MHPNVFLLQERIDLQFKNPNLAFEALIHPSFKNESDLNCDNERLEFLGDAILNAVVSDYLFIKFPNDSEGTLSMYRCEIVAAPSCALLTEQLDIGELLILGKGEKLNGSKGKSSSYANLFEAIVGAIYLDQGFETVKNFLIKILPNPKNIRSESIFPCKNKLQEYSQKHFGKLPEYEIVKNNFINGQFVFSAIVRVNNEIIGEGTGTSKKAAETEAARKALEQLPDNHDN